ncbi:MAG: Acyl-CoA thioester hydrolase YbgC [Syntrophaceae bacterium PtaU1.Bin231]|nr:MAG: Acyl-CoA thioester hydrolase YbgC [Syntrophaceae bacterium PtaU1.Bin231]HOG15985.1 thioesterase family protein [Syntrophales bacterium]
MKKNYTKVRVIYADTDAMGIVYHANYIRWFEIGRNELFREMGMVYADMETAGYHLPVTKVFCHYLKPARYDQVLCIESWIDCLRRASVRFEYAIWDEQRRDRLAEGYTVHACTNREGRVRRFPAFMLEKVIPYYPLSSSDPS